MPSFDNRLTVAPRLPPNRVRKEAIPSAGGPSRGQVSLTFARPPEGANPALSDRPSNRSGHRGRVAVVSVVPDRIAPAVAVLTRIAHPRRATGGVDIDVDEQNESEADGGKQEVHNHGRDGSRVGELRGAAQPDGRVAAERVFMPATLAVPAASHHRPGSDSGVSVAPTPALPIPAGQAKGGPSRGQRVLYH